MQTTVQMGQVYYECCREIAVAYFEWQGYATFEATFMATGYFRALIGASQA